jgi:hypothetical protein
MSLLQLHHIISDASLLVCTAAMIQECLVSTLNYHVAYTVQWQSIVRSVAEAARTKLISATYTYTHRVLISGEIAITYCNEHVY